MENTLRFLLGDDYSMGSQGKSGRDARKSTISGEKSTDSESSNFEESEISVILEFVEEHYSALYGHGTGTEIKARKDKMWKVFVETVNKVYK